MNRQQAQEILTLHRGENLPAPDLETAEALRFAQQDPELARWFEQHCARQKQLRAQFHRISVPAGLKEQIITERKPARKIIPLTLPRRIRIALPIAAAMALILGLALFLSRSSPQQSYAQFRNRMLSTALRAYSMDLETSDLHRIETFLAEKNAPTGFPLPRGLDNAESTGCVLLRWQNQPVSMICFRTGKPLPPGQKSDLFLFVVNQPRFAGAASTLKIEQVGQVATAHWSEGGKFYLLARPGDENQLREFL